MSKGRISHSFLFQWSEAASYKIFLKLRIAVKIGKYVKIFIVNNRKISSVVFCYNLS